MKKNYTCIIILLLFVARLNGQRFAFENPPGYNTALHTINNKLWMVTMTTNRKYECLIFDTSLNLKYRWPINTIRQPGVLRTNFVSNNSGLICIEQVASPGMFTVHLTLLNEKGTQPAPPQRIQFADSSDVRTSGQGFRYVLSPDKNILLLYLSAQTASGLSIYCITLNNELQILRKGLHTMNLDSELEDFRVPEPANDGTIYFLKTDKFYNYRLSTRVSLYATQPGTNELLQKEVSLAKKKIRSVNITDNENSFLLSAFCSTNDPEPKVSSFITVELSKKMHAPATVREYSIAKDLGKKLTNGIPGISQAVAVNNIEILTSVAAEKGTISACVYGPVYAGKFLDINSYTYQRNSFEGPGSTPYATSYNQRPYARASYLNMLSLKTDTVSRKANLALHRVEKMEETFYRTWIKVMKGDRLHHFVYTESENAKMLFTSFSVDDAGKVIRKKLFSDPEITIESGLPAAVINNSLFAFYYNKVTDQAGLIRLSL